MKAADNRQPQASSSSTAGRLYQPGIGPFPETEAIALTLAEMRSIRGGVYARAGKQRYPASRNECDLAPGELPDWAIEVKMARLRRDNGQQDGPIRPHLDRIEKVVAVGCSTLNAADLLFAFCLVRR